MSYSTYRPPAAQGDRVRDPRQRSHRQEEQEAYQHRYGPTSSFVARQPRGEAPYRSPRAPETPEGKRKLDFRDYQERKRQMRGSPPPDPSRRFGSQASTAALSTSEASSTSDRISRQLDDCVSRGGRSASETVTSGQSSNDHKSATVGHRCRLCRSDKSYKSDRDFAAHLTVIHYKDKIMKHVGHPFQCLNCKFAPAEHLSVDEKSEELLMHYGCDEKVAEQYYQKECSRLPDVTNAEGQTPNNVAIVCLICKASHDNERLFLRHLTLRHFGQELCEDLPKKPPFKCPDIDCGHEKTTLHYLMLHYGCDHNVSMELYSKKYKVQTVTLDDDESPTINPMLRESDHLSEAVQGIDKSGTSHKKKTSAKETVDLIVSTQPEPHRKRETNEKSRLFSDIASKNNAGPKRAKTCMNCPEKRSFPTRRSLDFHTFHVHMFPNLSASGPYQCTRCSSSLKEKGLFARHFIESHWEEPEMNLGGNGKVRLAMVTPFNPRLHIDANVSSSRAETVCSPDPSPLPSSRVRQTIHKTGELTARQRMVQQWESTSIDAQRIKIEELEHKLKEVEECHKLALKKKAEEFERWITQKERALATEEAAKKALEEKLEQAAVDKVDLKKQLEQLQSSYTNMETMLAEKSNLNQQFLKDKRQLEKKISALAETFTEFEKTAGIKQQETTDLKGQLSAVEEKVRDLELNLGEKDEEIKELSINHDFEISEWDKKMKRLEKQVEFQKTRADKLQEEKKDKLTVVKELGKKHRDMETELKEQIQRLSKENKSLQAKTVQEKKQEIKKMEKDNSRVEELEQQLRDTENQVELLETERNVLLDSLERLQRILKDFEQILQEKNDKLKELGGKFEDAETNLEEALQKLKDHKGVDKEKKEQSRQIKQLQSTLKDWEARQFTNVKLIAGVQKENLELKKKVKDFEENHTGAEEELYELSTRIKNLDKDLAKEKERANGADQERAKSIARLESKNEEVDSLKSKNLELESQLKLLEKEIRQSSKVEEVENLKWELQNQEGEIKHLKQDLGNVKNLCNQLKIDNCGLQKELKTSRDRNEKFETDYSKLVAQYETLKTMVHEKQQQLVNKNKILQDLCKPAIGAAGTSELPAYFSSSFHVKQEPVDTNDVVPLPEFPSIPDSSSVVDAVKQQIVLNVPATDLTFSLLPPRIKTEPDGEERLPPPAPKIISRQHSYISSPSTSVNSTLDEELLSFFPANESPLQFTCPPGPSSEKICRPGPASSKKRKYQRRANDVIMDEEANIVCGICAEYDPPLPTEGEGSSRTIYTTEWVGCDCNRWFHKQCTKLSRFTDRFSCRSVKMKCMKNVNTSSNSAVLATTSELSNN